MEAVVTRNLYVNYGNVRVLENINLTIKKREFFGIVGPNGAGKSTLLKVISGQVKPASGEIFILGKKPQNTGGLIGYVPQVSSFNRFFPVKVLDVVLMGRLSGRFKIGKKFSETDIFIAEKLLKRLDLMDLKGRQIGKLSGGQLQKVLLARALAVEPEILLLDEPVSGVDFQSRIQIFKMLKELKKDLTVVMVTHDLTSVSSYFDRFAVLNKKLHYQGEVKAGISY